MTRLEISPSRINRARNRRVGNKSLVKRMEFECRGGRRSRVFGNKHYWGASKGRIEVIGVGAKRRANYQYDQANDANRDDDNSAAAA
jgi:hypothetical protein